MAGRGRIVGLVLGLFMVVSAAHADTLPVAGPFGYHTADPTQIRVELPNKLEPERSLVLRVPRSAILFISNFDARETPVLSDSITVDGTFRLGLAAPDGTPFGEAVQRWAETHHSSPRVAVNDLRAARTMAEVWLIRPGRTDEALYSFLLIPGHAMGFEFAEAAQFEGLVGSELRRPDTLPDGRVDSEHYAVYDDSLYFRGSADDFFDYIVCSRSNVQAGVFCDYYVRVNDLVRLKVVFVDFRFNGGRVFAADRMRMVVTAYCGYAQDHESARCVKASGMAHDAD